MPKSRQTDDACDQLCFAITQGRLDQTRRGHEPHFVIGLSAADSEKTMRLLIRRE